MIKVKLTAGSTYISDVEAQAIEQLQQLLSTEDGYLFPVMFIGNRATNREIDAILLLPDAIFLLDFKNWRGQKIEVEGINGRVRRLLDGAWEVKDNTLPNYEYAARVLATRLRRERWLKVPRIYSALVFTSIGFANSPQVVFAGGDPQRPEPRDGVGVCRIEQFPQFLAAFRTAVHPLLQLDQTQLSTLAKVLLGEIKPPTKPSPRRIEGHLVIAEHHTDSFLNCIIYQGEGEPIKEPVWIKQYDQVLAPSDQRSEREQLILRHADVLYRFPQHKNIVDYRVGQRTTFHLYVILARKPGAFLSELLSGKPFAQVTGADLQHIPFDLHARLHILSDLLNALEYLTQQQGFEHSAYRDLRPDSIFVQYTSTTPIAQLFNFDCTKLPGSVTKQGDLKEGLKRSLTWEDYASPELLEYIESGPITPGVPASFTGDVSSDLFSWAVIAWELLTGVLPFSTTHAKLQGRHTPWPSHLVPALQPEESVLAPTSIQLIERCLERAPANRPSLVTLRRHFS